MSEILKALRPLRPESVLPLLSAAAAVSTSEPVDPDNQMVMLTDITASATFGIVAKAEDGLHDDRGMRKSNPACYCGAVSRQDGAGVETSIPGLGFGLVQPEFVLFSSVSEWLD